MITSISVSYTQYNTTTKLTTWYTQPADLLYALTGVLSCCAVCIQQWWLWWWLRLRRHCNTALTDCRECCPPPLYNMDPQLHIHCPLSHTSHSHCIHRQFLAGFHFWRIHHQATWSQRLKQFVQSCFSFRFGPSLRSQDMSEPLKSTHSYPCYRVKCSWVMWGFLMVCLPSYDLSSLTTLINIDMIIRRWS